MREDRKASKLEKREWSIESKAEAIRASKMPESQKREYLQQLGVIPKAEQRGVPFAVYAKIRKIAKSLHSAMVAYPKAKGISLASLEEWDEIFKNF